MHSSCISATKMSFSPAGNRQSSTIGSSGRIHRARTYLAKAGLLGSVGRGNHQITAEGKALLASKPDKMDVRMLERYPACVHWLEILHTGGAAQERAFSLPRVR
ncbi:winged helix-turn-helix domain-containing protein [Haematobacter genomosp. 1]|uniref:winged helix-turn-helix domain-containing protein n=1 Tax=Haematobacter genomosp. 1 TaxID=366618 RepID=UPI00117B6DED